jgi:hypothetical protein
MVGPGGWLTQGDVQAVVKEWSAARAPRTVRREYGVLHSLLNNGIWLHMLGTFRVTTDIGAIVNVAAALPQHTDAKATIRRLRLGTKPARCAKQSQPGLGQTSQGPLPALDHRSAACPPPSAGLCRMSHSTRHAVERTWSDRLGDSVRPSGAIRRAELHRFRATIRSVRSDPCRPLQFGSCVRSTCSRLKGPTGRRPARVVRSVRDQSTSGFATCMPLRPAASHSASSALVRTEAPRWSAAARCTAS